MNDRYVDELELAELLGNENEACAMARGALASGAGYISHRGSVPATHLVGTYRARMKSTAAKAIATVGLADAVNALDAAGTTRVAIGDIGGPSDVALHRLRRPRPGTSSGVHRRRASDRPRSRDRAVSLGSRVSAPMLTCALVRGSTQS
jgi:hypothetical protein